MSMCIYHGNCADGFGAAWVVRKALEDELKRCHEIMSEQHDAMNPTYMGEPLIDDDANRWRWITRAGRTRELRIPATEGKESIDAAIDSQRLIKTPNAELTGA